MPIWLHIIIVLAIVVYFIFRYIKDRFFYEILFVIWAPITLLSYVSDNILFLRVLGYLQVILFIAVIFFMFKKRGERRHGMLSLLAKMGSESSYDDDEMEKPLPTDADPKTDAVEDTPDQKSEEKQ